jgi:hypothetical protein
LQADRVYEPHAFSRVYQGRGELIDHILAGTNLARRKVQIAADTTDRPGSATNRRDADAPSGPVTHPVVPRMA